MKPGDYVLPSSESESRRLEKQAMLYGGIDFLTPFLEARPVTVLDVGCGTGVFTRQVAASLPSSNVLGVDMDQERLALARSAGTGVNDRYESGELTHLPVDSDSVDLVFCRFVLIHAPDPTAALGEMVRVCKPGGQIVAYEMMHDGIWFSPPKPAMSELLQVLMGVMRERGMEPSQGLHVAPALIRAGLEQVEVQAVPHHALAHEPLFEVYRRNWIETVSGLDQILGASFDADLIARALEELERTGGDELLLELAVLAHGRKPTA